MVVTWFILIGLAARSEMILLSGAVSSLKLYTDKFQKPTPRENVSANLETVMEPSRFDLDLEKPKTLQDSRPSYNQSGNGHNTTKESTSKVVVAARIANFDEQAEGVERNEWKVFSEPTISSSGNVTGRESEDSNFEFGLDKSEKDEVRKYINDYQNLLYTFKNFVNIAANPDVKKKLDEKTVLYKDNSEIFNITYIMPIPTTKKYFEIRISNLTETQHKEITILLQKHMQNKTNVSPSHKNKESNVVFVGVNDEKKQVSRDLTESFGFPEFESTSFQNSTFGENWPHNPEEAMAYFKKIFTEKQYNDFLNVIKTKSHLMSEPINNEPNILTNKETAPLMKNNGFHAEIITDYRHDGSQEIRNTTNSFRSDKNTIDPSKRNSKTPATGESFIGTATTILNPIFTTRNITKLTQLPHFKSSGIYYRNTTRNVRIKESTDGSLGRQRVALNSPLTLNAGEFESSLDPTMAPIPDLDKRIINENIFGEIMNSVNLSQTTQEEAKLTNNQPSSAIGDQDWMDISKIINNSPTNGNITTSTETEDPQEIPTESTDLKSVLEAANLIVEIKKMMEENKKKENERHISYIKKHLRGNDEFTIVGRNEDGSIMKINKQDNILEELKLLMVDYFESMNFNIQDAASNSSISAIDSIMNATDIFELMERSSRLVKHNLQTKMQIETKEPTGFVKKIVESQVEKCKQIFNSSLFTKVQRSPNSSKEKSHKRLLVFTKCMNFKLRRCIKGFSMWLEKGKFYLRPHFKLHRAYEHYEVERNLYCLRTYNPSSLGSNPHGVKVRPRKRMDKKSGKRMRTGQSKYRSRMMKKNGSKYEGKVDRRNAGRPRKNNYQGNYQDINGNESRRYNQQPGVRRYSGTQKSVFIRRQKGQRKSQQSEDDDVHGNSLRAISKKVFV